MRVSHTARGAVGALVFVGLLAWLDVGARAAEPVSAAPSKVTLNLPEELDLKVLIEYVGKRQNISFVYDDRLGNVRVTLKTPKELPADSLLLLLDSVLKMKGFMMVPTGAAGIMRIEPSGTLTTTSLGPREAPDPAFSGLTNQAVTRVFELQHSSAQRAEQVLKPFLSGASANITPLDETGILIVTDYAGNFKRFEELLAVIDRPSHVAVRFVKVANLEAPALVQQVLQLLAAKGKTAAAGKAGGVTVLSDERTNQVVVVGSESEADETVELIRSLDTPLGLETRTYTLAHASPELLDRLIRKQISEVAAKRFYRSATDAEAGLLVVTTTPDIHAQIETLSQSLDKQKADLQNPIRFYKMKNAKAVQVLAAIRGVLGEAGLAGTSMDGVSAKPPEAPPSLMIKGPTEEQVNTPDVVRGKPAEAKSEGSKALVLKDARLMADESTNSIIVVAPPSAQSIYEKLIERLDVLQPQVLIEATMVLVDTTNDFSLGVELGKEFSVSDGKPLVFSSFGLSERNPSTGQLTLKPGVGFNGVMLSADIADVVIRALQSDSRARVMSRPSVLVNDNATGTLASESEEPFSSQNTVNTVTSTSFGGYASAGTTVKVTPQISEGEHLRLRYEITLSSFGKAGSAELPPPRQTNTLASEVTIPNGNTIVVGGLTRENYSEVVDRVPLLGSIPGLEYLFSNRSRDTSRGTLFVFIRAVILRDDKFENLKVLSHEALGQVGLTDKYPASEPVEVR
jgi:general secretion pathway protein D